MISHKKAINYLFSLLVLLSYNVISQNSKLDSLLTILNNTKVDTLYCNILSQAIDISSDTTRNSLNNKQISFIENRLKNEKNEKIILFFKKKLSSSYLLKGNIFVNQLKANEGIVFFEKSLKISELINDSASVSVIYQVIGSLLRKQSNYPKALVYLKKSLKIEEKRNALDLIPFPLSEIAQTYKDLKDTTNTLFYLNKILDNGIKNKDTFALAYVYREMGEIVSRQGKLKEALNYFNKSIICCKAMDQKGLMAFAYQDIGFAYSYSHDYDNAIYYMEKGLKLYEEINSRGVPECLYNIGLVYFDKKDYSNAIKYFEKSLSIRKDSTDAEGIINTSNKLAEVYFNIGNYKQAEIFGVKAFGFSKRLGYPKYLKNTTELLYKIYKVKNVASKALEMYEIYIQMNDSINSEELKKESIKRQYETEYEKKALTDSLKIGEERKVTKIKFEKEKTQRYALYGGLVLFVIFSGFMFNRYRASQKQKQIIESQKHLVDEKQKEIIESITYAKRLQEAILPPQEFINKYVPNNFILYKPKDLVAGDFYWAEHINDLFFIAAADSTGHGVPGAMVSVVCSNALNRTVKEFNLTETGKILDKTRELVLETFEKSTSEVKDGMDISLLCIDSKNKIVFWSGANNPLWYIQDNELKEIKADKQPIGKTEYPKPFTTHQIEYMINTTFYLFTDGFADQFGGPKGKKFKYKQFSDLLVTNTNLTQQQQAATIDKAFEDWKGNLEQVDDVCVIGIKI